MSVPACLPPSERQWRHLLALLALALVLAQGLRVTINPSQDFRNHRLWGQRFLSGSFLYEGGLNVPYTPIWALVHAPFALMPVRLAQLAMYVVGVSAIAVLLWTLHRMTRESLPLEGTRVFWVAAGTLALSSRFVVRDLADGGPNLVLVTLAWIAFYHWTRARWRTGAALMGAAAALKLTAALFIAYWLLRRQWKIATAAIVFTIAVSLAPAVWQGRASYRRHIDAWSRNVWDGVAQPDPRIGILGLETAGNIALRPALARFLMHMPEGEGDQGRFVHPLNVDVLALPATQALWVTRTAMLVLLVAGLWALAWRWNESSLGARAVWDGAALGILTLLLSPITWRQHAVAIIPACYLLVRVWMVHGTVARTARVSLGFLVLSALVLSRGVMGPDVALLAHVYYLHTWALLGLLVAVIRCRACSTP